MQISYMDMLVHIYVTITLQHISQYSVWGHDSITLFIVFTALRLHHQWRILRKWTLSIGWTTWCLLLFSSAPSLQDYSSLSMAGNKKQQENIFRVKGSLAWFPLQCLSWSHTYLVSSVCKIIVWYTNQYFSLSTH